MAEFIVRVEMHDAEEYEIYDDLHTEMKAVNFERKIIGSDKKSHQLPDATYYWKGDKDRKQVWKLAYDAAIKVKNKHKLAKDPAVVAVESIGITFSGLEEEKK